MLADAVTTMYLSKEERQKLHISTDGVYINADDPANTKLIASMFGKRAKQEKNKQSTNGGKKEAENEQKQPKNEQKSTETTENKQKDDVNSALEDKNDEERMPNE